MTEPWHHAERLRTLLVFGSAQRAAAMAELLRSVGRFELVGEATTEAAATQWLVENAGGWQLLVTDLILSQGTGMGVIATARLTSVHGTVLVFSDYATPDIRRHCALLGANAVFQNIYELNAFMAHRKTLAPLPAPALTAPPM